MLRREEYDKNTINPRMAKNWYYSTKNRIYE